MADLDPPAVLRLAPDEQVIWQGRAAVGASWPAPWVLALRAGLLWAVLAGPLLVLAWFGSADLAAGCVLAMKVAGVVVGFGALVLALSKAVGPCYLRIAWLLLVMPLLSLEWARHVARFGLVDALEHSGRFVLLGALFAFLPALSLVGTFVERLGTTYLVTDRRVAALVGGALRWHRPHGVSGLDDLRLERDWRAPWGELVVGPRRLALRDDEPEAVMDLVRRSRQPPPP
ncbi:MAG: hypothetical protein KF878_10130 [Planctomycetes bacterium]|nr:hypothetical protein [Planctomycetota bacterium]